MHKFLTVRILMQTSFSEEGTIFESLDKHLNRLLDIQQQTDQIIRSYQEFERIYLQGESPHALTLKALRTVSPPVEARFAYPFQLRK